ncbi:uncharacterized protein LOC130778996 [Actinidia eriantha]|uniref:uncharacterized protein LOC130778996 n=1 Tax=Actinidia eriantha TaxID=165200 RepID=UPI00258C485C|nr:uncharacterized protein LOC130778996 [Actinidia eriantha]
MKNNSASIFFKHIISVLCSITKAKLMAIRNKTKAIKSRRVVLSLLKNKKFSLASISHKIHAMLKDKKSRGHDDDVDQSKAIVLYNASGPSSSTDHTAHQDQYYYYYYNYNHDDNDQYQDLTHSLFNNEEDREQEEDDDELDLGDHNGSVIDLVRNSNMEAAAGEDHDEDFKLEDEIDRVADLFITKFHKRIRMQKLESFKRYQEMLQRSA